MEALWIELQWLMDLATLKTLKQLKDRNVI